MCTRICIYTHTCACIHTCVYVHTYVCTYTHVLVCVYVYDQVGRWASPAPNALVGHRGAYIFQLRSWERPLKRDDLTECHFPVHEALPLLTLIYPRSDARCPPRVLAGQQPRAPAEGTGGRPPWTRSLWRGAGRCSYPVAF